MLSTNNNTRRVQLYCFSEKLQILFLTCKLGYYAICMPKPDIISELLTRGTEEVIVRENIEKRLRRGEKLRVKFGIDPTAPEMHLGHLVPLRKLAAFQRLGHTIVFIMGDFTAMIGDPTGRNELRKSLTREETRKNAEDYLNEASKILNIRKAEVHYNSEWLDKLGISGLFELMSRITVQRALERDDFQKRIKEDREISLLESVYPLLQGYDSVAIRADIEIGGTDQKFNLLMGRRVQRRYGMAEQDVLTMALIEGTDGVRKMSKSYGNYISFRDTPRDVYGKVMSVPDALLIKYFRVLTDHPIDEVEKWDVVLKKDKANFPARDLKMQLAKEMVRQMHGAVAAASAEKEFISVFQKRAEPTDVPEKTLRKNSYFLCDLLVETGLAVSKSEARRLIEQGGVHVDGKRAEDPAAEIKLGKKPRLIKVGKRKFMKISTLILV